MFLKIIILVAVAGVAKIRTFRSREMAKDPEPPQRGKNRNRSRPKGGRLRNPARNSKTSPAISTSVPIPGPG